MISFDFLWFVVPTTLSSDQHEYVDFFATLTLLNQSSWWLTTCLAPIWIKIKCDLCKTIMCHCSKLASNVIFVNHNASLIKLYCFTWHHFLLWLNWASAQCIHGSVKFIDRKCSLSSDLQTIVSLLLTMSCEIISVINNSTPIVPPLPGMTFNTSSRGVKDYNKAKIKLEILNFSDLL